MAIRLVHSFVQSNAWLPWIITMYARSCISIIFHDFYFLFRLYNCFAHGTPFAVRLFPPQWRGIFENCVCWLVFFPNRRSDSRIFRRCCICYVSLHSHCFFCNIKRYSFCHRNKSVCQVLNREYRMCAEKRNDRSCTLDQSWVWYRGHHSVGESTNWLCFVVTRPVTYCILHSNYAHKWTGENSCSVSLV